MNHGFTWINSNQLYGCFKMSQIQQQLLDGMVNSSGMVNSLQDEFREVRPKSVVVVPETIDAVHQLILQDCHVTYREIETT